MIRMIKEARAQGLTQAQLARKAGINESAMSNIANGLRPGRQRLERIADAIGWPLEDAAALLEQVDQQ